jgi:hypothetical protein
MAQQHFGQQNRSGDQSGFNQRNDQRQDAQQRQQGGNQTRQFGGQQDDGRRQQSQQNAGQSYGAQQFHSMAEVALRGTALLWDLQMETARNLLRTQARTAALLGAPDYSELFRLGDDRARRIFAASTEQMLSSARQARETAFEVQRQIGRIAEQQTIGIAEEVCDQIDQINRHTEQGLQQIKQIATNEADRAEDVVDYALQGQGGQQGWANQQTGEQRPQTQFRFEAGNGNVHMQAGEQGGTQNAHVAQNAHGPNEGAGNNEGEGTPNETHLAGEAAQRESRDRERGRARR